MIILTFVIVYHAINYLLTIRTPRLHHEGIAQQLHEHLDLYDPSEMTIILIPHFI